jgi:hypothetical protein
MADDCPLLPAAVITTVPDYALPFRLPVPPGTLARAA